MTDKLISVEAVTYAYAGNGWRLHPSTFSVARGDILGIIGPNGSGKSTLLKLAAGVLQAPSGRVLLAGKDMRQLIALAIVILVGCRSVPANMAVNIDRHDRNVQELHSALLEELEVKVTTLRTLLSSDSLNAEIRAVYEAELRQCMRRFALATADKKLSAKINEWGKKFSDPEEVARIQAEREAQVGGSSE